jgi:ubiquinone/menaquinone biosynthesis C-methylase UbiE
MTSMSQPPDSTQTAPARKTTDEERRGRLYEEQVFPLIGRRLVELLVEDIPLKPHSQVLQIRCGLGGTTTDLLRRLDHASRIIDLESAQGLLDRARANVAAEQVGRRVFFRLQSLSTRLPFGTHAFDLVLANVGLADLSRPDEFLADLARVARPEAEVRVASPLRGTWVELLDVYRDVLVRLGREDALASLRGYAASFPEADAVIHQMEQAGLKPVTVRRDHWDLVFRSAREFFYAPVVEFGPLARWKQIAGKGPEVQDTFLAVKQAIDTYFSSRPFSVSIEAGLFIGQKPAESSS